MNDTFSERNGLLERARVLVVDDEQRVCQMIASSIREEGAKTDTAFSGEDALELAKLSEYDVVITDVQMPGIDGIELMHRLKRQYPETEVIIITGFGDIALAVEAMRMGAYDFIPKPIQHMGQIVTAAERALEKAAMRHEIDELRSRVQPVEKFESLVGGSPAMQKTYHWIAKVAPTESTVLIQGETGTGKELVAQAIHTRSKRVKGPFIAVNCGSLTEQLLESELFGHVKGAFTGAVATKMGLFEAASGGTILLDEIDSTSQHTQIGLLRVLQEKEIRPVGSVSIKRIDVRVIASTQKELLQQVNEEKFREDLYYRISAINLIVPPLRERLEDVPALCEHFLQIACERESRPIKRLLPNAIELLTTHKWPGNVRELENVIEQAALFSGKPGITISDLESFVRIGNLMDDRPVIDTLENMEREHILKALRIAQNNKAAAAKMLGIPRTTLYQRIKKHSITNEMSNGK